MYIIQTKNLKCHICGKIFASYNKLSSHILGINSGHNKSDHPDFKLYREKYIKGYNKG